MKYPNGVKQQNTSKNNIKYDNRGMSLEKDLNDTNQYYVDMNKAFIYKKPTKKILILYSRPCLGKSSYNSAIMLFFIFTVARNICYLANMAMRIFHMDYFSLVFL